MSHWEFSLTNQHCNLQLIKYENFMHSVERDAQSPGLSLDTGHTLATLCSLALWARREAHKMNLHKIHTKWDTMCQSCSGSTCSICIQVSWNLLGFPDTRSTTILLWGNWSSCLYLVLQTRAGQDCPLALSKGHPLNGKVITRRQYGTSSA